MNKVILLSVFTLFFSACSFEEDTRLVCDCERTDDGTNCDYKKNIPLVFNESQKKFSFDGLDYSKLEGTKEMIRFRENYITFDASEFSVVRYDLHRITLVLEIIDYRLFGRTSFYQCRIVQGV